MRDASTLPGWPRALRAELAAAYLGMSRSVFDAAVRDGKIPKPIPTVGVLQVWDRADLDAWLDERRLLVHAEGRNEWDNVASSP